jgi:outer membrane protein
MKWTKNKLMLLLLVGLCTVRLSGQDSTTLEQLTRLALENNYQIQILQKNQQMADNLNTPGNAGMRPSVGIGSDVMAELQTSESKLYTGITRSGQNAVNTRSGAWIEANWTVFDGMAMYARRDRLAALAGQKAMETRYYIEQTIGDLAESYGQIIHDYLLLDMYIRQLEISHFRLNLEETRNMIGSGNKLMYNQALNDVYYDSIMINRLQHQIRERQFYINRITGQSPVTTIIPKELTLYPEGLESIDQLLDKAKRYSPLLEGVLLAELVADAGLRVEKGQRYPQISLFSQYMLNYQTSETGIVETMMARGGQAGIRIRLNLYDGGKQQVRIQNALLEKENAQLQHRDLNQTLESELHLLSERHAGYQTQRKLLLSARLVASTSLEIASEQLRQGAINGYEFRLTQLNMIAVEQQLIDVQLHLILLETTIHRLCGSLTEKVLNRT